MAPEKSTPMPGSQLRNAFPFSSSSNVGPTSINLHGFRPGAPPPVPPRQSQSYSGYTDYGYNRQYYGYNNYGQYRNYGGYSSYGYSPYSTMPGYGYGGAPSGDVETRFFRNAEESTRATFRMVETIVQTFSSLTMLLESTYFAIMNSFRAILSVAENIARLRSTVSQLFSTFALIRFIKWLYRKLMRVRGSAGEDMSNDELWKKYASMGNDSKGFPSSTWSGLLMFSVFIVIPYLIHKISNNIKNLHAKGNDPEQWNKSAEPVYTATVLYDFPGSNDDELTVRAGQKIWLAPQSLQPTDCTGWYRATDHHSVGLVPANYIQIVGQLVKRPRPDAAGPSGRCLEAAGEPAAGAGVSGGPAPFSRAAGDTMDSPRPGEPSYAPAHGWAAPVGGSDATGETLDGPGASVDSARETPELREKSLDLPKESVELGKESLDLPKASLDLARESLDLAKESLNIPKNSVTLPRDSLTLPKDSVNIPQKSLDLPKESLDSLNIPKKSLDLPKDSLAFPKDTLTSQKNSLDNPGPSAAIPVLPSPAGPGEAVQDGELGENRGNPADC